jgi:O-antigen ligase
MALVARFKSWWRTERDPLARIGGVIAVIALGVLIGKQYMDPDKRMLAVMAAAVLFGVTWRLDTVSGIGLLIVALPYPRGTVFGSSNFAFVLLLMLIWLLRVTQRRSPPPRRTPVDWAIGGLALAYAISFYNIDNLVSLNFALQNTELFAVSLLMFYMVVSNVRDADDFERLQTFQAISLATILLLAVFELNHPGGSFIPGWIEFKGTEGTELNTRNIRVGGPFFDYELLSEFCALSILPVGFMILRASSFYRRTALIGLVILDFFVLFATVTRGAVISLTIGLLYLLFRLRRRLNVVTITLSAAAIVSSTLLMNYLVANFTASGNLGERIHETHFLGLVPENRVRPWQDGWTRFLEHPLIGHGPYYSPQTGTHIWYWPHDVYLYVANLVGLVGLAFFLALLIMMFMLSSRGSDDMRDPNYARAYLLIAHVQLFVFMIDEVKIEYLRNRTYQFEIWLMFAMLVAAYRVAFPRIEQHAVAPLRAAA